MGGFHLFTLADIPIRVSPWYLLLVLFFVRSFAVANPLLVGLAITVSLLAHELGHALVARHYRLRPHILLHGFGGVTGHERARSNGQDALIVAAGPLSGLALCAISFFVPRVVDVGSMQANALLYLMYWINLYWSLFNLLPMWPLDGGQLLRLAASKVWKPARGERITHIVSIVVVILVALASYASGMGMMMMFILALTAFQNVQALQEGSPNRVQRENPLVRELWKQTEAAYEAGREDEAVRLCHQLRNEAHVPAQIMARVWAILGVTATRKHEYEEALSYLKRAPDLPDVVEATAQCFYQLGMLEALEALAGTRAFGRLPKETREAIEQALRESADTREA
ncbi:MAG TPA: site-2 protease family protein [Polyangiales bacterium]